MSVVHIAGRAITIDGRFQRQRCSWCGLVLIDHDLENVQSIDGSAPATWEVGKLVEVDGNASAVVVADALPANSCALKELGS